MREKVLEAIADLRDTLNLQNLKLSGDERLCDVVPEQRVPELTMWVVIEVDYLEGSVDTTGLLTSSFPAARPHSLPINGNERLWTSKAPTPITPPISGSERVSAPFFFQRPFSISISE